MQRHTLGAGRALIKELDVRQGGQRFDDLSIRDKTGPEGAEGQQEGQG